MENIKTSHGKHLYSNKNSYLYLRNINEIIFRKFPGELTQCKTVYITDFKISKHNNA